MSICPDTLSCHKIKIDGRNRMIMINPLECFSGIKGQVALDRNPGWGYNTLILQLIPGNCYDTCTHIQYHTLPCLLESQAAVSNC